jgi:hypothetical protein
MGEGLGGLLAYGRNPAGKAKTGRELLKKIVHPITAGKNEPVKPV